MRDQYLYMQLILTDSFFYARCIRHFAIYELKWPERVNGDGSRALLPPVRDDISKRANTSVSAPHRKLAPPAISIPMKRPPPVADDEVEQTSHSTKKHKGPTGRPRGRPPKNKVGMSETAKQLLNVDTPGAVSRSGRTRVPSMKLRESEPPNRTRVSPRKAPPSSASVSSLSAASAVAEDVRHTTPPPPAPDGSSAGSPSRV